MRSGFFIAHYCITPRRRNLWVTDAVEWPGSSARVVGEPAARWQGGGLSSSSVAFRTGLAFPVNTAPVSPSATSHRRAFCVNLTASAQPPVSCKNVYDSIDAGHVDDRRTYSRLLYTDPVMPQFVIEREVPGAGSLSEAQIRELSLHSLQTVNEMGPQIQWLHSYVTEDKVYCVYLAPDEQTIREHSRRSGIPANRISAVRRLIDPTNLG